MSDNHQWMPPVTSQPQPTYGQSATHAYGPPVNTPGSPPPGSWTAPPKPGLIPLRPLTLGTILSASFQVLRRNPRPTFGFAFGIQSAIMLLTLLITGAVTFAALSRLFTASTDDATEITAGAAVMIMLSTLIPGVLSVVALALVQGVLMLEIQRATLGEKLKLKQLWRRARGRLGALIGWVLLLTLALIIALAVLAVLIVLLTMLGAVGIALAVVVGIFGGLALVALGAWVGTKLSLVPSVLMGERTSLRESFSRSWQLTNGYFWRTFGIQLLVSAILSFALQVITVPIQLVAPMAIFLIDPNDTGNPVAITAVVVIYLVSMLIVLVMSSVVLVVQSAATGLIYIDLRMRKEGLDLDLARYVEETSAGQSPPDPYQAP